MQKSKKKSKTKKWSVKSFRNLLVGTLLGREISPANYGNKSLLMKLNTVRIIYTNPNKSLVILVRPY